MHPGAGGKGEVVGDLTFHGVTRPVTLDVVFNGTGKGMTGEQRMGFSGLTTIKRSDFGVTKYVPLVGDDVTVLIETEFTKVGRQAAFPSSAQACRNCEPQRGRRTSPS